MDTLLAYLVLIQILVTVRAQWPKYENAYSPIRQQYMQLNLYTPNYPWDKSNIIQRTPYLANGLKVWQKSLVGPTLVPSIRPKTNFLQPPKVQPIRRTPFLPRKDINPRGRFILPNVNVNNHPGNVYIRQNGMVKLTLNGRFNVPNKISLAPRGKPIIPKTRIASYKKPYLINANQIQNPVAKLLYTSRDPKVRVNILSKLSTPDYSKIVEKIKKKFTVDLPNQLNKIPHFNSANDQTRTTSRKSALNIANSMRNARKYPTTFRRNNIVNATLKDEPHWFDLYNRLKALKDAKARNRIAKKGLTKQVTGSSRSVISNVPNSMVKNKGVLESQKINNPATDIPHFLTNPYEEEVSIFAHEQVVKDNKKSVKHVITRVIATPNRYDIKTKVKQTAEKSPIDLLNEYKKSIKENAHRMKQQEMVSEVKNNIVHTSNTMKHDHITIGSASNKKEKKLDDYMKDFFKQTFKKVVSPELHEKITHGAKSVEDEGKSKSLIPVSPLFHSITNHNRQDIIKTKSSLNENHVAVNKNIDIVSKNNSESLITNKTSSSTEGIHKSSNLYFSEPSSSLVNNQYNSDLHHIVLDTFNKTFRFNLGKYDDYDENDFDLLQKEKADLLQNNTTPGTHFEQMINATEKSSFTDHEIGYRKLTTYATNVSNSTSPKNDSNTKSSNATNRTSLTNNTSSLALNNKFLSNSNRNFSIPDLSKSLHKFNNTASSLKNKSTGLDIINKTSLLDSSSDVSNKSLRLSVGKGTSLTGDIFVASIRNVTLSSTVHDIVNDKKSNTSNILNDTISTQNNNRNETVVSKNDNKTIETPTSSEQFHEDNHLANKNERKNEKSAKEEIVFKQKLLRNEEKGLNNTSQNTSFSNEEHNEDSASQNSDTNLKSLKHTVYSPSMLGFDEEFSEMNEQENLLQLKTDANSMVDQRSKIKKNPSSERFEANANKKQEFPFDLKSKSHVAQKTPGIDKKPVSWFDSHKSTRAMLLNSKIKGSSMDNLTDVNKMLAFIDEVNLLATPPIIIESNNHKTLKESNVSTYNGNARSSILTKPKETKNHKKKKANKKYTKTGTKKTMEPLDHGTYTTEVVPPQRNSTAATKKHSSKQHTNMVHKVAIKSTNISAEAKKLSAAPDKSDNRKSHVNNSTHQISHKEAGKIGSMKSKVKENGKYLSFLKS